MLVLGNMAEAAEPEGLILDLLVIRQNPVIEAVTELLCEIDGEWLFATGDAATAAVDSQIAGRRLVEGRSTTTTSPSTTQTEPTSSTLRRRETQGATGGRAALADVREPCVVCERCRLRWCRVL